MASDSPYLPISTSRTADALAGRADQIGLHLAELPPTFDIDEYADLVHLRAALAPHGDAASATRATLRELGLLDTQWRQHPAPRL